MRKILLIILLLALPAWGQTQHGRINAKDILPRADKDDLGSVTLQWEAFLESTQFFTNFILKQTTADYTVTWADPSAARALSIPDPGTTAIFMLTEGAQTINGANTFSAQIVSSLSTGTAPLSIASTTAVANLNVDQLDSADWAAPAAIGSGTPAAGTFAGLIVNSGVFEYTDTPTLAASTTPSVTGGNVFLTNATASITDFTGGVDGQILILSCVADTTTSLVDSTPLFLSGAFTCTTDDTIVLYSNGTLWFEITRSAN